MAATREKRREEERRGGKRREEESRVCRPHRPAITIIIATISVQESTREPECGKTMDPQSEDIKTWGGILKDEALTLAEINPSARAGRWPTLSWCREEGNATQGSAMSGKSSNGNQGSSQGSKSCEGSPDGGPGGAGAAPTAVAVAGAASRRPSRSRSPNARRPPLGQPAHLWPVISELRRQAASAQGLVLTVETANPGSPLPRPQEPRPRGIVAVQLFAESLLAATAPKPRGASMLSSEERAALPWRSSSSASSNSAPLS